MKQLALVISGNSGPSYTVKLPGGLGHLGFVSLPTIISFAITLLLTVSVLLAFIFLLIGGIRWIMSGGDKKQLETAQKTIQYAIIGLVVVLVSFFIINFIGLIFGVNLLQVQIP